MVLEENKIFVKDISHEKHVVIPEGIEIVDRKNCKASYEFQDGKYLSLTSDIQDIVLPHSLKEFGIMLYKSIYSIYYRGTIDEFLKIKFCSDYIPRSFNFYLLDQDDKPYTVDELYLPHFISEITPRNYYFFKLFKTIHFHNGIKRICADYTKGITKHKFYFDFSLDELKENHGFDTLIKQLKVLNKTAYVLDENKQYKEVNFNIVGATKNESDKTYVDRFNNTFAVNESGELISFVGSADEVELPEQLEVIGKKVFTNNGFKKMYLNKNIKTFSKAAFVNKYKIAELYYPGSYEDFNKIYFEPGLAKRPVLESVGKLFVLNKEGKYYQVIFDHISMVEARGFSKDLVSVYLSRDANLIRSTCKKSLKDNPDGTISYVQYYDNQLKVIVEAKFSELTEEFKNYLLDNKVSMLMDDIIIDYAINKDTKINRVRQAIKSNYGKPVIEDNKFIKFNLSTKEFEDWEKEFDAYHIAVNVGKEITIIETDAFKGIKGVLINYDGDVKDWLKVNVKEGSLPKDVLVRCLDGTIEYVDVSHKKKETRDLYYGYAHMGNSYRYALQFAINSKKIWEFLKQSHLSIIAWDYFCGTSYHCYDYEDDDKEYCILEYHNFKMIYSCDVEAG